MYFGIVTGSSDGDNSYLNAVDADTGLGGILLLKLDYLIHQLGEMFLFKEVYLIHQQEDLYQLVQVLVDLVMDM